jgi:hypothetical protein
LREIIQAPKAWSELSAFEKVRKNFFDNSSGRTGLYLYENIHALPRFFFLSQVSVSPDVDTLLAALSNASIEFIRDTLMIAREDVRTGIDDHRSYGTGRLEVLSYHPDRIRAVAETEDEAILVVVNDIRHIGAHS